MRRCALALAGLLALPALAAAQTTVPEVPRPELVPHGRFAITPTIGARVPYTSGEYFIFAEGGTQYRIQEERGGSFSLGLNAEARIRGPLSALAGVTFTSSQQDIFSISAPGDSVPSDQFQLDGPSIWFAKAGLSYRLPDPFPDNRRFHPSAYVFAAPALVYLNQPDGLDDSHHLAINLGADAVTRIGRGNFAIVVGLEDYLTFWNTDDFRGRDEAIFTSYTEEPVTVEYDYGTSNVLLLRFGISYRH